MKEFVSAIEEVESENEAENEAEKPLEFKLDGRVMHAYKPNEGQLTFMLAAMGRGQSREDRFASIVNIMMASLRDEDQDYFESRLLTRGEDRLKMPVIQSVFEYLIGEWFATPTQDASDSVSSLPSTGPN